MYDASTTGIEEFVLHVNEIPSDHACMSCIYYEDVHETAHEAHVAELLGVDRAVVRAAYISLEAARTIITRYPQLRIEDIQGQACDTLVKQLCARGELKQRSDDAERVLAPFGFVSVLAGLYLSIEIVLRVNSGGALPTCNFCGQSVGRARREAARATWQAHGLRVLRPAGASERCEETLGRSFRVGGAEQCWFCSQSVA